MANEDTRLKHSILIAVIFVAVLWSIKSCELIFGWSFHQLGVYPHKLSALIGILLAPLIHGSWQHLVGNTLPILLMGTLLIYGYPKSRWWAVAIIWLFSGMGVWFMGRESFHIGSSGLTHGIFFYLFVGGILRRDKRSSALLMVAFYMYGGMLLTILPREVEISYEYHFFGALSGIVCATLFRHWDPKPVEKVYSWEQESVLPKDFDDEHVMRQISNTKGLIDPAHEQWPLR